MKRYVLFVVIWFCIIALIKLVNTANPLNSDGTKERILGVIDIIVYAVFGAWGIFELLQ